MPLLYGVIIGFVIAYQILPRAGRFTDFTSSAKNENCDSDSRSNEEAKEGDTLAASHAVLNNAAEETVLLGNGVKESVVVPSSYRLACEQSLGFFDDIPETQWTELYQRRARTAKNDLHRKKPLRDWQEPAIFYLKNYEPTFTCPHVRRVGGVGDGPKWTCDPHRMPRIAVERQRETGEAAPNAPPCLVYSIGSAGRFHWEDGLVREVGNNCEIHVFDPTNFRQAGMAEKNMFFHTWGLKSSYDASYQPKVDGKFLSLQETLSLLGHENRTIDILKVDCK